MRVLILTILPMYLWAQQFAVDLTWKDTKKVQVGELLVEVPRAMDQIVYYDDTDKRFWIAIRKQIDDNTNTQLTIQNIQTQPFEQPIDMDLSQLR
jgi:hypothetical protein